MRTQAYLWRLWAGFLFLPCGLMLVGCGGGSLGTVSGKVSYKGQPLKGGNVAIISKTGGAVQGTIQEDGSYSISKVPPGPATITVDTSSLRPRTQGAMPGPYANAPKEALPAGMNQGDEKRYVKIPDQYARHETSGLTLDVQKGSQKHDIELK